MNANTNPRLSHTNCNHPRTAAARKICRADKAAAVGITNETATTFEAHGTTFTKPVTVDTQVKLTNKNAKKIQKFMKDRACQVVTFHVIDLDDFQRRTKEVRGSMGKLINDRVEIVGDETTSYALGDVMAIEATTGPGNENAWVYLV